MTTYTVQWRRLVAEAIAAGATCVDCGTDRNLEGDHELPVSRGGLSTRANLAIRCRRCNRRKGNRVTRYQLRVPWPIHEPATVRHELARLPAAGSHGGDISQVPTRRRFRELRRAGSPPINRGARVT